MKAYTDIEQSKILEEILPIKSVDMWYWHFPTAPTYNNYGYPMFHKGEGIRNVPCWSLAALLEVLHDKIHLDNETYYLNFNKVEVKYLGYMTWDGQKCISSKANTIVDACYEMILKLHKLKLL